MTDLLRHSININQFCRLAAAAIFASLLWSLPTAAQSLAGPSSPTELPDAPSGVKTHTRVVRDGSGLDIANSQAPGVYDSVVKQGETVPRLTFGQKVIFGLRDSVSPFSVSGWVVSAAYSETLNSSPNYGQDGKAFAQRVGASAARNVSQDILAESVLAPILHEDPRYYKLGRGHSFFSRLIYSGSRPLITRTDSGHQTINLSLIGGNLGGASLTSLYYPPGNRNHDQILQTFGGSMGGSAAGYVVSEFIGDLTHVFHRHKSTP